MSAIPQIKKKLKPKRKVKPALSKSSTPEPTTPEPTTPEPTTPELVSTKIKPKIKPLLSDNTKLCIICCDNKDLDSFIECPYNVGSDKCAIRVCSQCFIEHNKVTKTVDCPGCRKELSLDFIQKNFSVKIAEKMYKKKEEIFIREQKAQLRSSDVQTYASMILELNNTDKTVQSINMKKCLLEQDYAIADANLKKYILLNCHVNFLNSRGKTVFNIKKIIKDEKRESIKKQLQTLYSEVLEIDYELKNIMIKMKTINYSDVSTRNLLLSTFNGTKPVIKDKKIFTFPCPKSQCRGYLSTQYKCQLCECYVCSKCHQIKNDTECTEPHVCKKEDIESTDYMKKNTRPCPKCHTACIKIEGCDQVFCINDKCYTAWSWSKGTIQTGHIHAVDYLNLLRSRGDTIPRAPGDIPGGICCDPHTVIREKLRRMNKTTESTVITGYLGLCVHIENQMYNANTENRYNGQLLRHKAEYVGNKITEKMVCKLKKEYKAQFKIDKFREVLYSLSQSIKDVCQNYITDENRELFYNSIWALVKFYNPIFTSIKNHFGCVSYILKSPTDRKIKNYPLLYRTSDIIEYYCW